MKPMRATRASKWQLSVANGFVLFRERYFEIDTIPKPCGLGSEGSLSGLYVPVLSLTCPTFVPVVSRICAAYGRQVSRCSQQRRRETGPLAFGALWRTRGGVAIPGRHV
jgi:hypothetical protein